MRKIGQEFVLAAIGIAYILMIVSDDKTLEKLALSWVFALGVVMVAVTFLRYISAESTTKNLLRLNRHDVYALLFVTMIHIAAFVAMVVIYHKTW